MQIVRTVADVRGVIGAWRDNRHRTAIAPTMGSLHAGHLSLVDVGHGHADKVVATLFVNPTQFGPNEDLDAYPRDEARDVEMLKSAGCDLLFAPGVDEMYPPGFSTRVLVDDLTDCLCGATRPGHFDGVSQVVTKLLNQAGAEMAIFGEKDWQQLAVVRRMVRDLDMPFQIIGAPTIREDDGLAMSSRNRYLTDDERRIASRLPRLLRQLIADVLGGEPPAVACGGAAASLLQAGFASVDYLELRTADALAPVDRLDPDIPARVFVAAHLGKARLIDNMAIEP